MRKLYWVALSAALNLAGPPVLAAGRVSAPIIIFTGGGQAPTPYVPAGSIADMPLEVSDAPVQATQGVLRRGDVIAYHTVRATEAIVLDASVKGAHRDIPVGSTLARVTVATSDKTHILWCDLRPTHRLLSSGQHDCLEDESGHGKLDRLWTADSPTSFFGPIPSGVTAREALPTAADFHPATLAERPTAQVGYRYCDGDGVNGPPRFAMVMVRDSESWPQPAFDRCVFGVWPNPVDKSRVDLAGISLSITNATAAAPASAAKAVTLNYKVEARIPAETIAPLDDSKPITALAVAPTPEAEGLVKEAALKQAPLVPTGALPVVTTGAVMIGQTFVAVQVRHGITGVLRETVGAHSWLGRTPFPVGQPVFGIPMSGTTGSDVVWCAPRAKAGNGSWSTVCFPKDGLGRFHWDDMVWPTMMPLRLIWQQSAPLTSSDPTVEPGPVNLPPMTLGLKLAAIKPPSDGSAHREPVYVITVTLDWGEGPKKLNDIPVAVGANGARLHILNGELLVIGGSKPDQMIVTVTRPLMGYGPLPL